jgi:hypothetical protein
LPSSQQFTDLYEIFTSREIFKFSLPNKTKLKMYFHHKTRFKNLISTFHIVFDPLKCVLALCPTDHKNSSSRSSRGSQIDGWGEGKSISLPPKWLVWPSDLKEEGGGLGPTHHNQTAKTPNQMRPFCREWRRALFLPLHPFTLCCAVLILVIRPHLSLGFLFDPEKIILALSGLHFSLLFSGFESQ